MHGSFFPPRKSCVFVFILGTKLRGRRETWEEEENPIYFSPFHW